MEFRSGANGIKALFYKGNPSKMLVQQVQISYVYGHGNNVARQSE